MDTIWLKPLAGQKKIQVQIPTTSFIVFTCRFCRSVNGTFEQFGRLLGEMLWDKTSFTGDYKRLKVD